MKPLVILFLVYVATLVLMSLVSFTLFNKDKKLAVKGETRIKEKTLLCSSLLNGAIGAFIGRKVAHHKTDKKYFSFTIYLGLICQIALLVYLAVLAFVL